MWIVNQDSQLYCPECWHDYLNKLQKDKVFEKLLAQVIQDSRSDLIVHIPGRDMCEKCGKFQEL